MGSVLVWRRSPSSPLPANSDIDKQEIRRSSATARLQDDSSENERPSRGRLGRDTKGESREGEDEHQVRPRLTSRSRRCGRAARAWKMVDAKTILTKRKYVRKEDKKVEDQTEKTTDQPLPSSNDVQTVQEKLSRLRWSPSDGGELQGVPFECFPHSRDSSAQEALDFLVNDIAAVSMPGARHAAGYSPKVHAYIKLAFEHPIFFHAMIAFSQGYKEVATVGATAPSLVVLHHRGLATEALAARLKDPSTCADDISILTAFLLVDNVWRYGENDVGRQHYAGLLRMVEMRGGLDQLGISGILKSMIDFAAVTDLGDSLRSPISTALPNLRYYTHPFSPSVCSIISKLPQGYGEIAMSGQLSVETIATIASLHEWLHTDPFLRSPAPHQQIGAARRCLAASKPPADGDIEETVCLGVWITSMRSFHARFSRMDKSLLDRIVELCQDLDRGRHHKAVSKTAEREHMAYVTLVAVEASDKCIELQSHVKILVDLLVKREKFARSWAGMEKVVSKFFWAPFAIDNWRDCWLRRLKRLAEAQAVAELRAGA